MIRKLPPHLVHQIAAGEVVERPASALKELIENALDAGATKLSIRYEGGGLKLLSVEDNGKGIPIDELPLAFESHATSKLEKFEDFENLSTFGFRGEALCSLAAVGDLEVWTTATSENRGGLARVAFGVSQQVEPADRRLGTRVCVRDLFKQLPARLKFLRSERSETFALTQIWRRYALAYPEVDFEITDEGSGKTVTLSKTTLAERTQWFFESEAATQWIELKASTQDWKLSGFLLRPRFFGKVKSGLQFYLNRRPIKDSKLDFAVRRGLEGFSLFPKDAAAVFFIEGDPKLFDVNVHPMKTEVRFTKPDEVFSLIVNGIRDVLAGEHRIDFDPRISMAATANIPSTHFRQVLNEWSPKPEDSPISPQVSSTFPKSTRMDVQTAFEIERPMQVQPGLWSAPNLFEYMGTIENTFLVASRAGELWVFDQHALHERVLYERLLKNFETQKKLTSQRLLFPIALKFEGREKLLDREDLLLELGFEIRAWNDGQIRLFAAPAAVKRDHINILCRLVENIDRPQETVIKDAISSIACHSAVRAHDALDRIEAEKLLRDFESEDALGHCPHGRPTFVRLQVRDFEKMFQRVV